MADPVAGERTPTKAAYDDRDLLAEALKQLYAAVDYRPNKPELELALDAAREALSTSHWPTRWQAPAGGGAGERTWEAQLRERVAADFEQTLYDAYVEEATAAEAHGWEDGIEQRNRMLRKWVVNLVVQYVQESLSRLRAAEEERDAARMEITEADAVLEAERDRLAEVLRPVLAWADEAQSHHGIEECAGVAQPNTAWDDVQDGLKDAALLAREALASLEGGNDG